MFFSLGMYSKSTWPILGKFQIVHRLIGQIYGVLFEPLFVYNKCSAYELFISVELVHTPSHIDAESVLKKTINDR